VDPGHGGKDIGAPASFGSRPGEPYEKNINLDIAQRLAALLKAEGASVTMTREDDTYVALQERAATANRLEADALVSIHCNSCETPNSLSGTSVYYDHPHSARFAALVQGELIAALGTVDKGVRNANFAVIRRTKGPGILVETAFINNDDDRERLQHPNFRERTARAIVQGLVEYLKEQPQTKEAGE
jgi:N-acetylmuramoyl-L-alanine amidase